MRMLSVLWPGSDNTKYENLRVSPLRMIPGGDFLLVVLELGGGAQTQAVVKDALSQAEILGRDFKKLVVS